MRQGGSLIALGILCITLCAPTARPLADDPGAAVTAVPPPSLCRTFIRTGMAASREILQFCEALKEGVERLRQVNSTAAVSSLDIARNKLEAIENPIGRQLAREELAVATAIAYAQNDRASEALAILDDFKPQAAADATAFARAYLYARLGQFDQAEQMFRVARIALPSYWCDNIEGQAYRDLSPDSAQPATDPSLWSQHHLPSWITTLAPSRCAQSTGAGAMLAPVRFFPIHFRLSTASFDQDRATKSGRANLDHLTQLRRIIADYPNLVFQLVGYSDQYCFRKKAGCEEVNRVLSWERANAVKDQLIALGTPAHALTVVGRGTNNIPYPNQRGKADRRNRLVELVPQETAAAATAQCPWEVTLYDAALTRRQGVTVEPEPQRLPLTLDPVASGSLPAVWAGLKIGVSPIVVGAEARLKFHFRPQDHQVTHVYVRAEPGPVDVLADGGVTSADAKSFLARFGGTAPVGDTNYFQVERGRLTTIVFIAAGGPIDSGAMALAPGTAAASASQLRSLGTRPDAPREPDTPKALYDPRNGNDPKPGVSDGLAVGKPPTAPESGPSGQAAPSSGSRSATPPQTPAPEVTPVKFSRCIIRLRVADDQAF